MKNLMIFFVYLSILTCSINTIAQNEPPFKVTIAYDAAGNRISRVSGSIELRSSKIDSASVAFYESLEQDRQIRITPNPTQGLLRLVVIPFDGTADVASVDVFGITGNLVAHISQFTGELEIDLTNYPEGMYTLLLKLNGKASVWKILKK